MRVTVIDGPPADRGKRVAYGLGDISEATAHPPRRPGPAAGASGSEVLVGLRYRLEDVRAGASSVVLEAGRGGFEVQAQDHHSPCALPTPIAGPIVRDGGPPFVARCLACGGSSGPYRRKNAPTLWRWAQNHRCVDAATLQALFERSGRGTTKKTARPAKTSLTQA